MLLGIPKPCDDPSPAMLIPEGERGRHQCKAKLGEQPQYALVGAFGQTTGKHRIARIERDPDGHRLAMPQGMMGQRLEFVSGPVTVIKWAGRPRLEGVATMRDLA